MGWVWVWLWISVLGLFYEHRFAMLIIIFQLFLQVVKEQQGGSRGGRENRRWAF